MFGRCGCAGIFRTLSTTVPILAFVLALQSPIAAFTNWTKGLFPYPGVSGSVLDTVVFDDGSGPALYVCGDFPSAGDAYAPGVARWDGERWSAVGSGLSGDVKALAVFDDGTGQALYAAGSFQSTNGVRIDGVAKWNGLGWSYIGLGTFDGDIRALVVYDDGRGQALYVGGSFTSVGGVQVNGIARWDGQIWSGVGGGVRESSSTGHVYVLAVLDGGSGAALYVSGYFDHAGSEPANNLARWNGQQWSAFDSGMIGSPNIVNALAVYDNGAGSVLYAGGNFTLQDGGKHLARWNGTCWSGVPAAPAGEVKSLIAYDDGTGSALYCGGNFDRPDSLGKCYVARLKGSIWYYEGDNDGFGYVNAFDVFDDGNGEALFVCGRINQIGGAAVGNVAKRRFGWSALGSGMNDWIRLLAVYQGNLGPELFAAGEFTTAQHGQISRLAKWDGMGWSDTGVGPCTVDCMTVLDDGTGPALYISVAEYYAIGKWDGAWSFFAFTPGEIRAMAVYDDGTGPAVYAGGTFPVPGSSSNNIAKLSNGMWTDVGGGLGGMSESVNALCVYDDGSGPALFAGGAFTTAGGLDIKGIAKWDGTRWSTLGGGLSGSESGWNNPVVKSLLVWDGGAGPALYVGGTFSCAGNELASNIARWKGSSWSVLGGGIGDELCSVETLCVFNDGSGSSLYAGGNFLSQPEGMRGIVKWDGWGWHSVAGGMGGANPSCLSLAALNEASGPALYAAGTFAVAADAASAYVARYGEIMATDVKSAKQTRDTGKVELSGLVCTALFGDVFYVEEQNRSSGIRAERPGHGVSIGQLVSLSGQMRTADNGERYIEASSAAGSGSASIRPVGMVLRNLGGGGFFYTPSGSIGQQGVISGAGLNNIGLLVRTWGRVCELEPAISPVLPKWFVLRDGECLVRVVCPSGVTVPRINDLVAATGISSCEKGTGGLLPLIRARQQSDITVLPGN